MFCFRYFVSYFAVVIIGLLVGGGFYNCQALPTPDEETFSREYAKELTGWLAALGSTANGNQYPCLHYNSVLPPSTHPFLIPLDKRNSELINSLLTLPKNNLNEVGK